jgi:hypothetical protein
MSKLKDNYFSNTKKTTKGYITFKKSHRNIFRPDYTSVKVKKRINSILSISPLLFMCSRRPSSYKKK